MPDLRAVEHYVTQLGRVETQAARAALARWHAARSALIAAISRSDAGQAYAVQAAISDAAQQISATVISQAISVGRIAQTLIEAQTGLAVAERVAAPALPLSGWQAATMGLFLAEIGRLHTGGADAAAILARLITGRDGRQSTYDQARVSLQLATEGAIWATGNGHVARLADIAGRRQGRRYQKQAIAAIDSRTTDCCLKVHGQIQDLDKPFQLRGTPRFADHIQNPPFHYRCRTATALYLAEMEAIGATTETMRATARAELRRRER